MTSDSDSEQAENARDDADHEQTASARDEPDHERGQSGEGRDETTPDEPGAAELAQRLEEFGEKVDHARSEWERKKSDPNVPGAPPDAHDAVPESGGRSAPANLASERGPDDVSDAGQ